MDNEEEVIGTEAEAEEIQNIVDNAWDDDSVVVEDDDVESEEVDQPEEEENEEEPEEETADEPEEEEAEDTDQWLELKHLDEVKSVSKEEAKVLAQKGLDYDRIRGERDALKADSEKLRDYEAFLEELKGDFGSIEELMDDTRARLLADKEDIGYDEALKKVQKSRKESKQEVSEEAQRKTAVQAFVDRYPNVKGEDIPEEVWAETRANGGDLVSAYSHWETKQLQDRIKALEEDNAILKQNQKNKARSAGSSKSSGKSKTEMDSYLDSIWAG